MPRSRKSSGTPVAGSSSATRLWEDGTPNSRLSLLFDSSRCNPHSLFPDTTKQGGLGHPCLRLEMAGA